VVSQNLFDLKPSSNDDEKGRVRHQTQNSSTVDYRLLTTLFVFLYDDIAKIATHNESNQASENDRVYRKDWRWSQAKQQLQGMIDNGTATKADDHEVVYIMCDDFGHYMLKNFKTNLINMLKMKEAGGKDDGKVYLTN
jgi:hypothetical protein